MSTQHRTRERKRQRRWKTGVKCDTCGREIVAINVVAYATIIENAGRVPMRCNACLGRGR